MSRLLFLDTETTGLDSQNDMLLEVGMVVVELPTFEIIAEDSTVFHFDLKPTLTKDHHFKGPGRDLFIHRKVVDMHKANGLWEACRRSQLTDYQKMEEIVSRFIVDQKCQGVACAGANPGFDRGFLKAKLPGVNALLHYRNFETNSFWLLQSYITGQDAKREKPATHRAVDDCKDAIKAVEAHFDFMTDLCGKD